MPELAEVETMRRGLNTACVGSLLRRVKFMDHRVMGVGWGSLGPKLEDARLESTQRRGKHIICMFESRQGDPVDMVISPRMTGVLTDSNPFTVSKHVRASLDFDYKTVLYHDVRMFGKIHLSSHWLELGFLQKLGRDLLAEECDLSYLIGCLDKARSHHRKPVTIKEFLICQEYIAGIGNYMASEILYAANLKPTRLVTEITTLDCQRILSFAKSLALLMISYKGVSLNDYITFDGSPGQGQHYLQVYGREVCPEGHPIVCSHIADRVTYHCDICQD